MSHKISQTMAAVPEHLSLPMVSLLSNRVARVLGANPHAMTLGGSNTYLIGSANAFILKRNAVDDRRTVSTPPVAEDSPFAHSLNAIKSSNNQRKRRPVVMLVDTGEGKSMYTPHLNFALRNGLTSDLSPVLGGIYLTHWHGDHVGGVCDVLLDAHSVLRLAHPQSTAPIPTSFPIIKRNGLVMPNATLHKVLSVQLEIKIKKRLALIDQLIKSNMSQGSVILELNAMACAALGPYTIADLWQFSNKYCFQNIKDYPLVEPSSVENENLAVKIDHNQLKVEQHFLERLRVPAIIDPVDLSVHSSTSATDIDRELAYTKLTFGQSGGDENPLLFEKFQFVPLKPATDGHVRQHGMLIFGDKETGSLSTYSVLTSPGHTDDHTLLFSHEERSLITADTVLGGYSGAPSASNPTPQPITTAFTCYADYMSTLEAISTKSEVVLATTDADKEKDPVPLSNISCIYPGHGPAIDENIEHRVDFYIAHRMKREHQVLSCLKDTKKSPSLFASADSDYSPTSAAGLVDTIYQGSIPFGSSLVSAAQGNVLHILRKLHRKGMVSVTSSEEGLANTFLAEKDYPLQLGLRTPPPSEIDLERDVYAMFDGAGESPPPQNTDGGLNLSEKYALKLVWQAHVTRDGPV